MAELHVFLIHSRLDTNLPNIFDKAFGKSNVFLWEAEWAEIEGAPWVHLIDRIKKSLAVFFLKGPNITSSSYTKNWICWEIGVAAAMKKRVWVFESLRDPIFMPLPYLTDYVVYDPNDYSLVTFIANLLNFYAQNRPVPQGISMNCASCHIEYNLHTALASWNCPSCQRNLSWTDPDFTAKLANLTDVLQPQGGPPQFARFYSEVQQD